MRLILANPHYFAYGKTVANFFLRRKSVAKYDYFRDFYLKDKRKNTAIYIDGTKTSWVVAKLKFTIFPKSLACIELFIWFWINRINPFGNKIFFNLSKLDPSNDVVVDFARSFDFNNENCLNSKNYGGIYWIFFTHYFLKTRELSQNIQNFPAKVIAAENNLVNNDFFQNYFPFINEVYHLPFAFSERFVSRKEFSTRKNKCLAVGSISPIEKDNKTLIDFYGTRFLQPMKKKILDEHRNYPEQIDNLITLYENYSHMEKKPVFFKYIPSILLRAWHANKHGQYYKKFDIVEKFNQYKMFVCPEEIIGLPSISAFEGMACGCAFLGIDDPMYTGLGFVPGVHYIAYKKNNIDDLVRKISYWQNNPKKLEVVAARGCEFVRDNFNRKKIADVLWKDLERITKDFSDQNKVNIRCSFI